MIPKIIIFSTLLIISTKSTWTKIKEIEEEEDSEIDKAMIENIVDIFIPVMIPNLIKSMNDEEEIIQKIIQSIRPETLLKAITDEQKIQLFLHNNSSAGWMTQAIQSMDEQQKKHMIEELSKNYHICNLSDCTKSSLLLSLISVTLSCIFFL